MKPFLPKLAPRSTVSLTVLLAVAAAPRVSTGSLPVLHLAR